LDLANTGREKLTKTIKELSFKSPGLKNSGLLTGGCQKLHSAKSGCAKGDEI